MLFPCLLYHYSAHLYTSFPTLQTPCPAAHLPARRLPSCAARARSRRASYRCRRTTGRCRRGAAGELRRSKSCQGRGRSIYEGDTLHRSMHVVVQRKHFVFVAHIGRQTFYAVYQAFRLQAHQALSPHTALYRAAGSFPCGSRPTLC